MRSIRVLALALLATAATTLVACNLYIDEGGHGGGTRITGSDGPDAGTAPADGGRVDEADASIGGLDGGCVDHDGGGYGGPDASIGGLDGGRVELDAGVERPDARSR